MDKKQGVIEFKRARDYRVHSATGAWGGVAPQGDIFCDFYIDHLEPPEKIPFKIEEGKAEEQREDDETITVCRELQIGVLLKPNIAFVIGHWLIQKAKEAGFTPEDTTSLLP